MSLQGKKVFTRKPYTGFLYKWAPETDVKRAAKNPNTQKYFCTATPGSQGEDWICNYVYNLVIVNGQQVRLAYVECDYVE